MKLYPYMPRRTRCVRFYVYRWRLLWMGFSYERFMDGIDLYLGVCVVSLFWGRSWTLPPKSDVVFEPGDL